MTSFSEIVKQLIQTRKLFVFAMLLDNNISSYRMSYNVEFIFVYENMWYITILWIILHPKYQNMISSNILIELT